MRLLMKGILCESLIALCCAALSGCGSVQGQGPDHTPVANSTRTQNPNVVLPDSKEGGIEQWRSCVQRLHPVGSYPASEIQAMFESPQNIQQLLYNLKVAANRGLLLQPAFYDEATLLKFFHGSKVILANQNVYMEKLSSGIEARIETDVSPKLYIIVESVCRAQKYTVDNGATVEDVSGDSFLYMGVGLDSPITLRDIRSVFGPEDQLHMAGEDPDLPFYLGSDKGSVVYENVHRPGVDDSRIQTRFFLTKNHVDSIGDNDEVRKVQLHDMQEHIDFPIANSAQTQNVTAVPPDKQGGGVKQWKSCARQFHLDGVYAASEIQAMFESPQSVPQFLQNLKIAADRRLLQQPSFYDEATLRKFFNSSKVTVAKLNFYLDKHSSGIDAHISSDTVPTVDIYVRSICTTVKRTEVTNGSAMEGGSAYSSLKIVMGPGPLMTLRDIRSVFGRGRQPYEDQGIAPDGPYIPTYKGSVTYPTTRGAGLSGIQTQIYFRKDGMRSIGDSDVVREIEMSDIQYGL